MSDTEMFSVTSEAQRNTLIEHIRSRELFFWVKVFEKLRTVPQNDRLHPLIRPISEQLSWYGRKLTVDQWKIMFMDALNAEYTSILPSIDGRRSVSLGMKTSQLSVADFGDLMTIIEAFKAEHGIVEKKR